MARELDVILKELDASYSPDRDLINQRLKALPGQAESEISGLRATQDQAFGDILSGAQQRGMGFGGVPIAEQSRYTASSFLPAVARVKQAQNESQMGLQQALNDSNSEQRKYAMSLREAELNRDEQARQFAAQMAAQERQAAAARAASSGGSLASLLGGGGGGVAPAQQGGGQRAAAPKVSPVEQEAYNDVAKRRGQSVQAIQNDYYATYKSAGYGNQKDKLKLLYYAQMFPDIIKQNIPARAAFSNKVSF